AQLAGHAVAVHEAAPTLVHPVVVDAERRIDAAAHRANALRPLQVQPPEAAVEIDDAAGGSGRGAAECEELAKPALAAVGAQAQRGVLPDAPLPVGAELAMIDAFARVEGDRSGAGLPRVAAQLGARQAERVERVGLGERDRAQREAVRGVGPDPPRGVEVAPRAAVLAPAVSAKGR